MNHHLKPMLLALLLGVSTAACGSVNAAPPLAGPANSNGAGAVIQPDVAAVSLRSARYFAILAGSTVTSTGASHISGDVGISPGTAMTGFPPGIIDGRTRAGGPVAKQAQMDLTAAYNDAMGRVRNPITVAGNLGGQTLVPGLYKSTSSLAVSSGDLTLDARGNPNAVFLFQMASTFTMTAGRRVIMINGAKARNVFWVVGSSATFGTQCSFHGNLLVAGSISLGTGTRIAGRAMARSGAVTLESNSIVRPPL